MMIGYNRIDNAPIVTSPGPYRDGADGNVGLMDGDVNA